jgi:hypothetical protein
METFLITSSGAGDDTMMMKVQISYTFFLAKAQKRLKKTGEFEL